MNARTISTAKADKLFWLGRYAERTYLNLHLLRAYYDKMIDGDAEAYEEYCKNLSLDADFKSPSNFVKSFLYDKQNPFSISAELEFANDNAMVLREEITSETLGYIQMSIAQISSLAKTNEANITHLQPITDNLLSMWGSIEERVLNDYALAILMAGKIIEQIDIRVRFDYPFDRVELLYERLKTHLRYVPYIYDVEVIEQIDKLLTAKEYSNEPFYKEKLLSLLNSIVGTY
ncbi:MAG: alpha-E domain-containing protein [Bacteroidales bacterium]|nr:alpha-E domain-containing protein [Candidatus Scybalocola fimicaballi]MCQ2190509.1 alpha-E domain-containing protein [Paludibacteraceae bacterium]